MTSAILPHLTRSRRFHIARITALAAAIGMISAGASADPAPVGSLSNEPLFISGQGGYHTHRIPALAVTPKGTALAFCEGRRKSSSDSGDINLALKRSGDHGQSWSDQQVVWDDGGNTCGNPCPVVDRETGAIWLLMTWNRGDDREPEIIAQTSKDTRRIFVTSSTGGTRDAVKARIRNGAATS